MEGEKLVTKLFGRLLGGHRHANGRGEGRVREDIMPEAEVHRGMFLFFF